MATRVLLTIDTELRWQPQRWRTWQEAFAASYDPAGVGVAWQLARLAEHGLKATFFVDPMPACRWGIEPVRRMIEPILAAGQQVQLHIHPQWTASAEVFELVDLDEAAQHRFIADARDLLIEAGAPPPVAFRAGSYAANDATLRAAAALGLAYDSSHNGSEQPWPSAIGLPAALIAPVRHAGLIEVPVTQIGEGTGLRHLQLCAVSSGEMAAALGHAAREAHPLVTIVSHSFELASRDARRPNRVHLRRFEALLALLDARRAALPTAWFTELGDVPLGADAVPWPGRRHARLLRGAEQIWSNFVDERA